MPNRRTQPSSITRYEQIDRRFSTFSKWATPLVASDLFVAEAANGGHQ